MAKLGASSQIDAASVETREQRAARVEKSFYIMQEAGRLGIHMWEEQARDKGQYEMPKQTLDVISRVSENSIVEQMRHHSEQNPMPLLSCSLLPKPSSHRSILPYEVEALRQPHIGYLFDLSQEGENPPKVVVASKDNLYSDGQGDQKVIDVPGAWLGDKEMEQIYRQDGALKSVSQLIVESAGEDAAELTERKLDSLSDHYTKLKYTEWKNQGYKELPVNELFIAANKHHIAGIFVPYRHNYNVSDNLSPIYDAWVDAAAALAGLEHCNHGMNVPVMRYDVNGEKPSVCEYVGQGKDELEEVFAASYATLKQPLGKGDSATLYMREALMHGLKEIETHADRILGEEKANALMSRESGAFKQ